MDKSRLDEISRYVPVQIVDTDNAPWALSQYDVEELPTYIVVTPIMREVARTGDIDELAKVLGIP